MMNVKLHVHHSHVIGHIHGYAYNFCNWKVKENQISFSCLPHNFLVLIFTF